MLSTNDRDNLIELLASKDVVMLETKGSDDEDDDDDEAKYKVRQKRFSTIESRQMSVRPSVIYSKSII